MMLNYQSQAVQQPVPAARHARVCFVRPNVKICARDCNDAASPGASELQALVCDLAGFQSDACKALLHEADVLKTVKALASGDINHAIEYFGDPLVSLQCIIFQLGPVLACELTLVSTGPARHGQSIGYAVAGFEGVLWALPAYC